MENQKKELFKMTNRQLINYADNYVKRDNSEIRDIVYELTTRVHALDAKVKYMEKEFLS